MTASQENITQLGVREIFVFGSNTDGRHGKGAAKTALGWGAVWGQGEGPQGRTYGIPTKGKDLRISLSVNKIGEYVNRFIRYAKENPEYTFLVTEIGCGLAGYKPKDIAPLFTDCISIENIRLPARFIHKLQPAQRPPPLPAST